MTRMTRKKKANNKWEDNYMIEYGLPNYNDLTLVDARFDVYDTELYG